MDEAKPRLAIELSLLGLLALLWGSSYLFTKVAVADIPPLTLVAARVAIAAAVLTAVMALRGQRFPRDRRTWRWLLVQSALNASLAWSLLAWGQQHIEASLASVLNSTSPLFVFFLTVIFTRHEPVGPLRLAGACLGLVGVLLIVGVDALAGLGQQVAGQLAALGSALLFGCAAIYGRRFGHLPATVTAAGTTLAAALCLIPLSLLLERPWTLRPGWLPLGATLVLGVFCTGTALLIYFRLVRTLGSLGAASQSYLRAGVGVLLGVVVLGEEITALVALGVLAAVAGVAAINLPRRSVQRPE